MSELYEQARAAMQELVERAKLKKGQIVVVGCSTSEIMGARIGSSGTLEVAQEVHITQAQVSRLEKSAIKNNRKNYI